MNLIEKINETATYLQSKGMDKPEVAIILGSGLGDLANEIENPIKVKYKDIPNFPESTVKGHESQLVFGELGGKKVLAMQGRFHYYEGYELKEVVFPVRIMKALGVKSLIVTNAAGACNKSFNPGDLMIINDHINFALKNPLVGQNNEELGTRFPDMSQAYNKEFIRLAQKTGEKLGLDLKEGVYMWVTGPSYETPSEVRMARTMGADALGMSTVPEVIVARHGQIDVLGISCITNMASGILEQPLNHLEVIETSQRIKGDFMRLIKDIVIEM